MTDSNSIRSGLPDVYSGEVILRLTHAIEWDYINRGVFPQYRTESAAELNISGQTTIHYVTSVQAQILLEDAQEMYVRSTAGAKVAYMRYIERLKNDIEVAAMYKAAFEKNRPILINGWSRSELWRGTKEQLASLGMLSEGPYPGEPGGKSRWLLTHDPKGRKVHITRASREYFGMFDAEVFIPDEQKIARIPADVNAASHEIRSARVGPIGAAPRLRLVWSDGTVVSNRRPDYAR